MLFTRPITAALSRLLAIAAAFLAFIGPVSGEEFPASDGVAALRSADAFDIDLLAYIDDSDRSTGSARHAPMVEVPEPLLFDLVRPLGARKGEIEVNTLALFPWSASNTNLDDDPFGSGPTTRDRKGIEWAPEIEFVVVDNFAIEFEFPLEGSVLEEYKLGLQQTFGAAFNGQYIHGVQVLIEPTVQWEHWNTALLYLGGIRFDDVWSALFMIGGRMNLEGPDNYETFERLINGSLFADIHETCKVGLETNYASKLDGTAEFILVPQIHCDLTESFQVQTGVGLGVFSEGQEQSYILRVIYAH